MEEKLLFWRKKDSGKPSGWQNKCIGEVIPDIYSEGKKVCYGSLFS